MATIETGFFLIITIMAFGFMIYSFKFAINVSPILRTISIVLFFTIGLYLVSGYGVASTSTTTDGTTSFTETKYILQEEAEGFWLGFVFVLLAFVNMFLMYMDFFKKNNEEDNW